MLNVPSANSIYKFKNLFKIRFLVDIFILAVAIAMNFSICLFLVGIFVVVSACISFLFNLKSVTDRGRSKKKESREKDTEQETTRQSPRKSSRRKRSPGESPMRSLSPRESTKRRGSPRRSTSKGDNRSNSLSPHKPDNRSRSFSPAKTGKHICKKIKSKRDK